MKIVLTYGEVCDAIDEYIERHHPTLEVTADTEDEGYEWEHDTAETITSLSVLVKEKQPK